MPLLAVTTIGKTPAVPATPAPQNAANTPGTPAPASPQSSSVYVLDFDNKTGDPVFDTTLREALAVQLEQSPLLKLVSHQHMQQSLQYIGKPADFGEKIFHDYNDAHYHQPSDEYHDDWDFAGMEQMANFGLTLGLDIAGQSKLPTWQAGDEFLKTRQQSGVQ